MSSMSIGVLRVSPSIARGFATGISHSDPASAPGSIARQSSRTISSP